MMILEVGQVCPYSITCPHNNNHVYSKPCYGSISGRLTKFHCEFVVNGNIAVENKGRIPGDLTGKMKVIID